MKAILQDFACEGKDDTMAGLMDKTHWIWVPDWKELVNDTPTLVRFRKTLTLTERPEHFVLKISADTRYKLYVNQTFVEFGPARGDLRVWYVDEVDLAPWLVAGSNIICVEVLRYAVAYRAGNFGMFRTATPGLFVEAAGCTGEKAECAVFAADETWKCKVVDKYAIIRENPGFAPLMYLEDYTCEDWEKNWKNVDYDDSDWAYASAYRVMEINTGACPGDLSPRPIPYLTKELRHFDGVVPKYEHPVCDLWNGMLAGNGSVTIPANTTEVIEINAGEEMCGYISLRFKGGKGTKVTILAAESYYVDGGDGKDYGAGNYKRKADRLDWINGELDGYADIYHVTGYGDENGEEIYEPFWFRTFRFVRLTVETGDEPCEITGFDYLETNYPLGVKTTVQASDPSFEGIWDLSMRTLRRCMHETYEDCPFYEQLQYACDGRNEILYTYMISADDRLARQCMEALRLSQRADGMINCCYPNYGPNIIPGFSIYYIMMVYDHMMYFGDRKLVLHHMGAIDQILEYFDNHLDPRGMVGKTGGHISERYWSFIDWTEPWGDTVGTPPAYKVGPITMESLLYIMGLQHAAALCDYVGRHDTAKEYRSRAAAVQNAVNTYCRDENGIYLDGPGVYEYSQHCQVYSLLTDTVSVEKGRELVLASLADKEKYAQCTVAQAYYLFRALEKIGAYEYTDEIWDIWRDMLKKNLTTCVENPLDGRSDCHAWGSLLLYELPATILGVQPGAPGFEKIKIAPVTGKLNWANGDVITPKGNVHVEWTKGEDGHLTVKYTAPEGVEIVSQ